MIMWFRLAIFEKENQPMPHAIVKVFKGLNGNAGQIG